MKKVHIVSTPTKVSDLSFEDLYGDISRDWQEKAKLLQIRRWRALKRSIKGDKPT